jgi:hypothetical protein
VSHRGNGHKQYREYNKQGATFCTAKDCHFMDDDPELDYLGMGATLARDQHGWMRLHATLYGARMARKYWEAIGGPHA